ncbi:ATP-binding protein [uncultured Oxalicibacterium sp.]|uniref:ATP-binding protein n=1 Tax=uncultured Oxalicibacterium sp. TaxID=1168540 RepID=UPI0025D9E88E|nr:ATP-binding protein [uncultured Oxalicibacterium sp.]
MKNVVYLTGAPATGKSSLCKYLAQTVPDLLVLSYSALLRDYINKRQGSKLDEDDIREQSARAITAEDVAAVDQLLIEEVNSKRNSHKIIIDSHPVTIEEYGFRITQFALEELKLLNPDALICLYAAPDVIRQRIEKDPAGRPLPAEFALSTHVQLQAAVCTQYALMLGRTCYMLDTDATREQLAKNFLSAVNW